MLSYFLKKSFKEINSYFLTAYNAEQIFYAKIAFILKSGYSNYNIIINAQHVHFI